MLKNTDCFLFTACFVVVSWACEFPNFPLLDQTAQDFVYCHPQFGPSCPGPPESTLCEYRWLGFYICCSVESNGKLSDLVDDDYGEDPFSSTNRRQLDISKLNFSSKPSQIAPGSRLANRTSNGINDGSITEFTEFVPSASDRGKTNRIALKDTVASAPTARPPGHASSKGKIALDVARKAIESKEAPRLSLRQQPPRDAPRQNSSQISFPRIVLLQQGDWVRLSDDRFQFPSTVSLVQDRMVTILVDTGATTDKTRIIQGLRYLGMEPDSIDFVVLTHGHPDHFGNVGLFPNASHYFGTFLYRGTTFSTTDLLYKDTLKITPNIVLVRTPGHTMQDLTVMVRRKNETVAIVGDLFTNEADTDLPDYWTIVSANPTQQLENRKIVLCMADTIIPGHGKVFNVTTEFREKFDCETVIINQRKRS